MEKFNILIFTLGFFLVSILELSASNEVKLNNSINDDKGGQSKNLKEISLYSNHKTICNNLSLIAAQVKFINLNLIPLLDDFKVADVAVCSEYIFLLGLHYIYQYSSTGRFVKKIGKQGKGPDEFLQFQPPIQLDTLNNLIYAFDIRLNKIFVYDFKGNFIKKISVNNNTGAISLISTKNLALRYCLETRFIENCNLIDFIDIGGEKIRSFKSNLYPIDKGKIQHYGIDMNFLWCNSNNYFSLEYGSDTIFRIENNSIKPEYILTGNLKPEKYDFFQNNITNKLVLSTYILRPNSGIFESNQFINFRLNGNSERFFCLYNKITKQFCRTFYSNTISSRRNIKICDYFIDDLVSGLPFNPVYQSNGHAICFVSALNVLNRKQEVLDFIQNHPSDESLKLKRTILNLNENSNPILMIVKFK